MSRIMYLLKLKVHGIKNIETPVEFNFYKSTIKNDFDPENYKIKAIYGENGSGKTAIITAVKILKNLILDKSYVSDSENQKMLLELVNKKIKKGFIEIEFISNIVDYNYINNYRVEFKIGNDNRFYIVSEKLMIKKATYSQNKFQIVYETKDSKLLPTSNTKLYEKFKERSMNLLDQRLLPTWIPEILISAPKDEILDDELVAVSMLTIFAINTMVYIAEEDNRKDYFSRRRLELELQNDEDKTIENMGQYLKNILSQKDLNGLFDGFNVSKKNFDKYKEKIDRMCSFVQIFKPDLKKIEIDKKNNGKYYKCRLNMVYEDYSFDTEFESRGIKKIIDMYDYLDAACNGDIVFVDELDSNINDIYLDKLVEYFMLYGEGQLCFTSHNLSPMDVLKENKNSINFISSINTVHVWANNGNLSPINSYKNGFIADSPFNVKASDFLGVLGGLDE